MKTADRRLLTVLWCTALVVIAGCSAEQGIDDLPAPATLTAAPPPATPTETVAPPESSAPATDAPPGSEPTAGPGAEFTAAELEAALTAVDAAESLAAVILTDTDIRELVDASGSGTSNDLTVTPEECNVFADSDLVDQAQSATLGVMTFAGASSLQPDSLSLTSQDSDEVVEQQIDANRTQLAQCSEFEMNIDGEVVSAAVTELSASTAADETFAVRTVVQVPGTIQETVSLTALIGTTTINVALGSSGDIAQDLDRGERLVDATVSALQEI